MASGANPRVISIRSGGVRNKNIGQTGDAPKDRMNFTPANVRAAKQPTNAEYRKSVSPGQRGQVLPGLDGLRALAVAGVLLYHADMPWMSGGFLGVDLFFVLSGYLITTLLLREWRTHRHIDLAAFWARRARRLLPALFLLLLAVLAFVLLFMPAEVARTRADALWATFYSTNWYLIISQQPYFEAIGRPPLLQHLWSLAVEEQFYLLWPLLLILGLKLFKSTRTLLLAIVGAAAVSVSLMVLLHNPDGDASRVYYGTDTRAAALLIGCALALALTHAGHAIKRKAEYGARGLLLDATGLTALYLLVVSFVSMDETQPLLYPGGFVLMALAGAVAIGVSVHSSARLLPGLLGLGLLRWVGLRSYGIYLWHWPIFAVTRPGVDVPLDGPPLLALRLALTVGIAALSYRFVEVPIRNGALGQAWKGIGAVRAAGGARATFGLAGVIAAGLVLVALAGSALVSAKAPAEPEYIRQLEENAASLQALPSPTSGAASSHEIAILTGTPTPEQHEEAVVVPTATAQVSTPEPTIVSSSPVDRVPTLSVAEIAQPPTEAPAVPPTATEAPPATVTPPPTPRPTRTKVVVARRAAPPATTAIPPTSESVLPAAAVPAQGTPGSGDVPESDMSGSAVSVLQPTAQSGPPEEATQEPPAADNPTAPAQAPDPGALPPSDPAGAGSMTAIGDSVMLGALKELRKQFPNIDIDAEIGRQTTQLAAVLQEHRDAGVLGSTVIVHLGNNGYYTSKQIAAVMGMLADTPRVLFINDKVPRAWERSNNDVLRGLIAQYSNATLLDWHAAIVDRPDLLYPDGIHLRDAGIKYYVSLIANALLK